MSKAIHAHFCARRRLIQRAGRSFRNRSKSDSTSKTSDGYSARSCSANSCNTRRSASMYFKSGSSSSPRQKSSPRLRPSVFSRSSTARSIYRVQTTATCAVIASQETERQSLPSRRQDLHALKNTSMPQRFPQSWMTSSSESERSVVTRTR